MEIFDNLIDILTEPEKFFRKINEPEYSPRILPALVVLTVVNAVFFITAHDFSSSGAFLFNLFANCIGGVILWYIVGGFFEFCAKIFNKSGKMKQIMSAVAYSMFPLIFFAPVQLLKPMGHLGYFFGVIFELIIYFWTIFLMAKAIEITYDLRFSRAVMFIFLPIFCFAISIFWLIEFFTKIGYIFK